MMRQTSPRGSDRRGESHTQNLTIRTSELWSISRSRRDQRVPRLVRRKFENFSTRLKEFIRLYRHLSAPGGWGTDLEASMFLQLKQLNKLEPGFRSSRILLAADLRTDGFSRRRAEEKRIDRID
jgi:hypothetical protein